MCSREDMPIQLSACTNTVRGGPSISSIDLVSIVLLDSRPNEKHFQGHYNSLLTFYQDRIFPIGLQMCLFVLDQQPHLSHGVNAQGRTYGDHPYHPARSLVSRPLSHVLFPPPPPPPPYFCHASCIRSVPSPVLLSCTYIFRRPILTKSLVCPFLVFPSYTYILNSTQNEPLNSSNPTYKPVLALGLKKKRLQPLEISNLKKVSPLCAREARAPCSPTRGWGWGCPHRKKI